MRVHPPGECSDSLYGKDCDGEARWTEDPFAAEVYDTSYFDWYCDGELIGRAMDV